MASAVREAFMGKKRAAKTAAKRPGQVSITQLKGSPEWRDWFIRLTEHSRMPGAVLIDLALKEWAERHGFTDQPPKR